jgi:hypothetical protein
MSLILSKKMNKLFEMMLCDVRFILKYVYCGVRYVYCGLRYVYYGLR